MLEESIIGDVQEVQRFLDLIATDPAGRSKITEIAKNLGLIEIGDIDYLVQRKNAVAQFEFLLSDEQAFNQYKEKLGVAKNEEVWQKFFEANQWILGSDFVDILGER